jgi:hypothetical protein
MNKEKVGRALTNDTEVDKAHTNKVDTALTIRLKLIQPYSTLRLKLIQLSQ